MRKQQFRAALALAGKTQDEFAAECGVTSGHLSHVVAGNRESDTLMQKVVAFIEKHLPTTARVA